MPSESLRELVLQELVTLFEAMQEGQPTTDPYVITWSIVTREPPNARTKGKRYVIAILEDTEEKLPRISYMDATLRVVLEFWVHADRTEAPSSTLNKVLGQIQRRMGEDIFLNGRAINVEEVGNETDVDSKDDRQLHGAIFYNIQYKHDESDPRVAAG